MVAVGKCETVVLTRDCMMRDPEDERTIVRLKTDKKVAWAVAAVFGVGCVVAAGAGIAFLSWLSGFHIKK
jgi:hypothetical protein